MGDKKEDPYAPALSAGALPLPEVRSPAGNATTSARRFATARRDAASGRWMEMLAIAAIALAPALLLGRASSSPKRR